MNPKKESPHTHPLLPILGKRLTTSQPQRHYAFDEERTENRY